jgi:predicted RNase H-like HicB family nuclease
MPSYYPAIVEFASEGFGVFFPDLPGCTTAGATMQEAARNAEDALQAHIDLIAEHHESLPRPSEIDAIIVDADIREAARILVRAELPGRAVRVNITLPEELLKAIDQYAARTGYSRSGLLAQAAREHMRHGRVAASPIVAHSV